MFKAFNKGELRYYDIFHQDKDYAAEAKALLLKGKTILEIGSGTGLMTKELRKLGYEVTTVDPNADADYSSVWDIPQGRRFDTVIALYDVFNYMTPRERYNIKCAGFTENGLIEMWDKSKGVKFFTYKKAGGCHRVRFGIRIGNIAWLKFIYWGKGWPALAIHKLYL